MIEDLDGATTEPSRRWHVAALSAATAVVSLVLFYVLVAPPTFDAPPQATSPSPTRSFAMTVVSSPRVYLPTEMVQFGMCTDRTTWAPLQLAVDPRSSPLLTVVYDRTGSRPIAFVREERGTGRLVLTCMSPESFTPRINRAR